MSEFRFVIPENFAVEEADDFREKTNELFRSGMNHFILDFKNCVFIDSTGLGVLVGLYKKCEEMNGSVNLISMSSQVRRVFEMTRLDGIFDIVR